MTIERFILLQIYLREIRDLIIFSLNMLFNNSEFSSKYFIEFFREKENVENILTWEMFRFLHCFVLSFQCDSSIHPY